MGVTINRGYPYPEYSDPADFPAQSQALATAIDTDLFNNLETPVNEAFDEPSVRAFRGTGTQVIPTGANTTLAYDLVETYDNDNMYNGGVSLTNITVQTVGTYILSGSVNLAPDGSATGSAALIVTSTGPVLNPVGVSRPLDDLRFTSLSCTTLHRVAVVPETLTLIVRTRGSTSRGTCRRRCTSTSSSRRPWGATNSRSRFPSFPPLHTPP